MRGNGKSACGAYKAARLFAFTDPPKDLCKFFLISETLEQAGNLWAEKLQYLIPPERIQRIEWNSEARCLPRDIILKAQAGHKGKRWQLLFRSAEQGRKMFAGHSNVAGFWLDEPCPLEIVWELWARCRENKIAGTKFWTLTPIDLPLPPPGQDGLEEIFEKPAKYPDWRFYRMNSECNDTLQDISFIANTPADMRETRRTGAFPKLTGGIFKEFSEACVVAPQPLPPTCEHFRVIDFGFQHETACLWFAREPNGRYWIYHEWAKAEQLIKDKVADIKKQVSGFAGLTYADPEDLQQRNEFAALGIPSTIAKKEPVNLSIEATQRQMMIQPDGRPNLLIFDTCSKTIQQIKAYRWQGAPKSKTNPYRIFFPFSVL